MNQCDEVNSLIIKQYGGMIWVHKSYTRWKIMVLQQCPLLDMIKRSSAVLHDTFCVFNFIIDKLLPSATGGIDDLGCFIYMQRRNARSWAIDFPESPYAHNFYRGDEKYIFMLAFVDHWNDYCQVHHDHWREKGTNII